MFTARSLFISSHIILTPQTGLSQLEMGNRVINDTQHQIAHIKILFKS